MTTPFDRANILTLGYMTADAETTIRRHSSTTPPSNTENGFVIEALTTGVLINVVSRKHMDGKDFFEFEVQPHSATTYTLTLNGTAFTGTGTTAAEIYAAIIADYDATPITGITVIASEFNTIENVALTRLQVTANSTILVSSSLGVSGGAGTIAGYCDCDTATYNIVVKSNNNLWSYLMIDDIDLDSAKPNKVERFILSGNVAVAVQPSALAKDAKFGTGISPCLYAEYSKSGIE